MLPLQNNKPDNFKVFVIPFGFKEKRFESFRENLIKYSVLCFRLFLIITKTRFLKNFAGKVLLVLFQVFTATNDGERSEAVAFVGISS